MKIKFATKTVPLALFAICVVAFGLLVPWLGFYLDDWHHIYFGYTRGLPGLWQLFLYDSRPFAAYFYYLGFNLLGFHPLPWQFLALILRCLTVIITWFYLRDIWPDHLREVTWAAVLFAVYPLFKQQALSVAYSLHWAGFLFYTLSIWAMVKFIRQPARFGPYLLLSLFTSALHLVLLEYFAGIELIRPFILWLLLPENCKDLFARLKKVLKYWWPYLLILLAFVVYRIFFIPRPEAGFERNALILVQDFTQAPLATAIQLLQGALQDTTVILYQTWNQAIDPALFEITQPDNVKVILVILLVGTGLFLYLAHLKLNQREAPDHERNWSRPALLIGLVLTVLGPLPAWLTDQFITTDNPLWSDRYGLAAMLGASLVVVALLEALVTNPKYRLVVLSVLLGLAVGWQVITTNSYRRAWIKQSQFYWQLAWRAPYIQPGTALLSSEEIFPYMTEVSTSFALSSLYPKYGDAIELDYWFFSLSHRFGDKLEELLGGMPLRYQRNFARFNGRSQDSLVIFYEPQQYECLWVLGPGDADIRALPEITRQVTALSDLERIKIDSADARPVPTQIFGSEPGHTWCYYFEKADLARQYQDWPEVIALWDQASQNGFAPGNGVEYLPFIDGFAHTGDWQAAEQMTYTAEGLTRVMAPSLCATWQRIERESLPSDGRDQTLKQVYTDLQCP